MLSGWEFSSAEEALAYLATWPADFTELVEDTDEGYRTIHRERHTLADDGSGWIGAVEDEVTTYADYAITDNRVFWERSGRVAKASGPRLFVIQVSWGGPESFVPPLDHVIRSLTAAQDAHVAVVGNRPGAGASEMQSRRSTLDSLLTWAQLGAAAGGTDIQSIFAAMFEGSLLPARASTVGAITCARRHAVVVDVEVVAEVAICAFASSEDADAVNVSLDEQGLFELGEPADVVTDLETFDISTVPGAVGAHFRLRLEGTIGFVPYSVARASRNGYIYQVVANTADNQQKGAEVVSALLAEQIKLAESLGY